MLGQEKGHDRHGIVYFMGRQRGAEGQKYAKRIVDRLKVLPLGSYRIAWTQMYMVQQLEQNENL